MGSPLGHLGISLAAMAALPVLASPARAQGNVPPGSLVVQRDVPPRAAQAKEPPGTPHYVQFDQSVLIDRSLAHSLVPLADQDIGNVSAVLGQPLSRLSELPREINTLPNITTAMTSSTNLLSSSQTFGSPEAIGAPLQAINQAVSALNSALGGPH